MPTFTPNFSLPYPNGLDAPCDFAEQWCDFSAAFQVALDGFQTVIDRTNPAIPIARMTRSTPITVLPLEPIPFESLSVDTANWVDFDADPTSLTIDRGGKFVIVANASTLAVAGSLDYTLTVVTTLGSTADKQTVATLGQAVGLNTATLLTITAPTLVYMYITSDVATTSLSLTSACLSVWWHADRSTP